MTQIDTVRIDSFQAEISAVLGGQQLQNTLAEFDKFDGKEIG
jgi:hypothetical protein